MRTQLPNYPYPSTQTRYGVSLSTSGETISWKNRYAGRGAGKWYLVHGYLAAEVSNDTTATRGRSKPPQLTYGVLCTMYLR